MGLTEVLERRGSSKDVWKTIDDEGVVQGVYFHFSDRVSIFDRGALPVPFPELGRLRRAISGKLFQELNKAGFNTHYISHDLTLRRMHVSPLNIEQLQVDYGEIAIGNILPVEILCRLSLTKKYLDRLSAGTIFKEQLEQLPVGIAFTPGMRLDEALVECSTKYEAKDRYISDSEAAALIGKDQAWLNDRCYSTVRRVFEFLQTLFSTSGGFRLWDGKIEGGATKRDQFVIADSISPDELRLIGLDGRSYDKDPVREYYENTYPEWVASLAVAKASYPNEKGRWPDYPGLPPIDVFYDVVSRYRRVAEAIGAV